MARYARSKNRQLQGSRGGAASCHTWRVPPLRMPPSPESKRPRVTGGMQPTSPMNAVPSRHLRPSVIQPRRSRSRREAIGTGSWRRLRRPAVSRKVGHADTAAVSLRRHRPSSRSWRRPSASWSGSKRPCRSSPRGPPLPTCSPVEYHSPVGAAAICKVS
jgi:hypothetical protein